MSIENLAASFAAHHEEVKKLANAVSTFQDSIDRIELNLVRPKTGDWSDGKDSIDKKAFVAYLRHGIEKMPRDLQNSLTTDDGPAAGYLTSPDYQVTLDKNLTLLSPIRANATVGTTSSGVVILPKRVSNLTGYFVGETEARTESQPSYGQTRVPLGTIASFCDVSATMLEDSAFDVGAEIISDFAESFAAVEGKAFISGDGVADRPEGILNAPGIATLATGAATSVVADSLISALFNLPQFYRARASWAMNAQTLAAISKLRSGDGVYLWQPSLTFGQPNLLIGRPVIECPDLPDLSAGSKSIILADFSKYRIFGKANNGVLVLRDPYSQAANGIVRFHGRFRVGGTLTLSEAFRILQTGV